MRTTRLYYNQYYRHRYTSSLIFIIQTIFEHRLYPYLRWSILNGGMVQYTYACISILHIYIYWVFSSQYRNILIYIFGKVYILYALPSNYAHYIDIFAERNKYINLVLESPPWGPLTLYDHNLFKLNLYISYSPDINHQGITCLLMFRLLLAWYFIWPL